MSEFYLSDTKSDIIISVVSQREIDEIEIEKLANLLKGKAE
jgi:hypothetical protein